MMKDFKNILLLIVIFAVVIILTMIWPSKNYIKSELYISEIMASNFNSAKDNYNESSDYIEIHNNSANTINLKGYHLTDSEFDVKKWEFPNVEIKKGEYLLVYASGLNECVNNICHTNFKLNSSGETISLIDDKGNIVSKVTYPNLPRDISYGYAKGKYMMLQNPTPGYKNDETEYKKKESKNYDIEITEYITKNTRVNYDSHGNYYDWVEIHNKSGTDITLNNVYISDTTDNLKKYELPEINIKKDGYLVLYLSKEKVKFEDNIYVPFGLSNEDECIVLSDGEKIFDKVDIVSLPENISYGKVGEDFKYFTTPTPGRENNTAAFDKLVDENGST